MTELSRPRHEHSDIDLGSEAESQPHEHEASASSPMPELPPVPPPPPSLPPVAGLKRSRSASSQQSVGKYNYNAIPVSVVPDAELRVAKTASFAQRRPKAQDLKDEHSAPFLCTQCGRRYTKVCSSSSNSRRRSISACTPVLGEPPPPARHESPPRHLPTEK